MSQHTQTFTSPPDGVEALLLRFLPESLTILRCIQLRRANGTPPFARLFLTSSSQDAFSPETAQSISSFTLSYVDVAGGPNTQMWLFSTLQCTPDDSAERQRCAAQLDSLTCGVLRLRQEYGKPLAYDEAVLLGSLETNVRKVLAETGRVAHRDTGFYDKWLMDASKLEVPKDALPDGLAWGTATLEDCKVVVARSSLPRPAEFLITLPSVFIKTTDGTPVAWAFLGTDGSLISVHTEESYRKKGLARLASTKLLVEKLGQFGAGDKDSIMCTADVAADNAASRAMVKSLGGHPTSEVSWVLFLVSGGVEK